MTDYTKDTSSSRGRGDPLLYCIVTDFDEPGCLLARYAGVRIGDDTLSALDLDLISVAVLDWFWVWSKYVDGDEEELVDQSGTSISEIEGG